MDEPRLKREDELTYSQHETRNDALNALYIRQQGITWRDYINNLVNVADIPDDEFFNEPWAVY